jgi:hypothetical protein
VAFDVEHRIFVVVEDYDQALVIVLMGRGSRCDAF